MSFPQSCEGKFASPSPPPLSRWESQGSEVSGACPRSLGHWDSSHCCPFRAEKPQNSLLTGSGGTALGRLENNQKSFWGFWPRRAPWLCRTKGFAFPWVADLLLALCWLVELQVVLLSSPPELTLPAGIYYFLKQACLWRHTEPGRQPWGGRFLLQSPP